MQQTLQTSVTGQVVCQHNHTVPRGVFYGHRLPVRTIARPQPRQSAFVTRAAAQVEIPNKGPDLWNKTYYPTGEDAASVNKPWYIVDAEGQTLGRLATMVAMHIRGKHLPSYTPSMDMGGYVIIINAEKVAVSGRKFSLKEYKRHTNGRPGTMKVETFQQLQQRYPEKIIEIAVKGMLPKGRLGKKIFHHLKVYKGTEHPHEAQQAVDITAKIDKKPSDLVKSS